MTTLPPSNEIRDRIQEIRSALFFNEAHYPASYSAGIISALDVDENGQIFFFISRPECVLSEDRRFPARLEFYRKGKPFFIKVNGIAEIVSESDQFSKYTAAYGILQRSSEKKLALVKVSVQQAEYNEETETITLNYLRKLFMQTVARFSFHLSFNFSNS